MAIRGTRSQPGGGGGARLPTPARELDHRHVALSLTIREATDADLSSLGWLGLDPEQRRVVRAALERCARGEEIVLVAASRDAPLAMIRARLARRSAPDVALIEALRVMPGLHRLGIATALTLALERVLRERGRRVLEVRLARGAQADLARFARLGYRPADEPTGELVTLRKPLALVAARPLHLSVGDSD